MRPLQPGPGFTVGKNDSVTGALAYGRRHDFLQEAVLVGSMPRLKRPRPCAHVQPAAFLPSLLLPRSPPRTFRPCTSQQPPSRPGSVLTPRLALSDSQTRKPLSFRNVGGYPRLPPPVTSTSRPPLPLPEHASKKDKSEPSAPSTAEEVTEQPEKVRRKRVVSVETRRKIAYAMLGQRKSDDMRAKVSEKLKGRVPWNKGKKLSPETRARMSEARFGRSAWNKGRHLSDRHRSAISRASLSSGRTLSQDTRRRMRMARRRPGDAIVGGSAGAARAGVGSYPLVDSADINDYVTLRRELRVWSDSFVSRNARRPSLADVRRTAPPVIMRKFEKYVQMRDHIRGLASDVYGSVNPADVPVVPAGDVANSPRNNNAKTVIRVTKHGNPRFVDAEGKGNGNVGFSVGTGKLEGAVDDMWDMYDRPTSPAVQSRNAQVDNSLIGANELSRGKEQLSANDYRMIGKYRLMETIDINRYMALRKELERWSAAFKQRHGRTPALSDAKSSGKSMLYDRFCEYLGQRDRMSGLVREVYGTEMDDMETFQKVNAEGRVILDTLRSGASADSESKSKIKPVSQASPSCENDEHEALQVSSTC